VLYYDEDGTELVRDNSLAFAAGTVNPGGYQSGAECWAIFEAAPISTSWVKASCTIAAEGNPNVTPTVTTVKAELPEDKEGGTPGDGRAAFMRIQALLNYNGQTDTIQVDSMSLRDVTPGVLIQDGAVTAEKIFANAVTADAILAGEVTAEKLESDLIVSDEIKTSADSTFRVQLSGGDSSNSAIPIYVGDEANPTEKGGVLSVNDDGDVYMKGELDATNFTKEGVMRSLLNASPLRVANLWTTIVSEHKLLTNYALPKSSTGVSIFHPDTTNVSANYSNRVRNASIVAVRYKCWISIKGDTSTDVAKVTIHRRVDGGSWTHTYLTAGYNKCGNGANMLVVSWNDALAGITQDDDSTPWDDEIEYRVLAEDYTGTGMNVLNWHEEIVLNNMGAYQN